MSTASRIRHSFIGKAVRTAIHLLYRARHPGHDPVTYRLPGGLDLRLYPEGEIAEFLAFPWLFEKTEVALVTAFLKPGMQIIDVGANIGLYSILARKVVGDSGSVWAFEPSGETVARLERNLALNACDGVRVFQLGLADAVDTALRLASDACYGDAYRYLRPTSDTISADGSGRDEVVPVTTLDRWADENRVDHADFLKVDIEGGEYRMFLGARRFLMANPGIVIMFECEEDWCERAGCRQEDTFDLLRSLTFGLHAWDGRRKGWVTDGQSLASAGMVWACRDASVLPVA